MDEKEEKGKKRKKEKKRQTKPSVPKPGNSEKTMENPSRVIQLRGSRPQGLLVVTDGWWWIVDGGWWWMVDGRKKSSPNTLKTDTLVLQNK